MSILINKNTKAIIQGLGNQGQFHLKLMQEYNTNIVAGVSPTEKNLNIPVYKTVKETLYLKPEWSIIFVPANHAKQAALEALNNNLNIVIITENIPPHDTIEIIKTAKKQNKIVIGPNTPGIIVPEQAKLGIMPSYIFKKGNTAVISRSGTLTYEIVQELTKNNIGQSIVIGIGGDTINGLNFIETLELLKQDNNTKNIVLLGEIGGNLEEETAKYLKNYNKPVIAFIAGKTAPKNKTLGHAGAIIEGNTGTAQSKINALKSANVKIANLASDIPKLIK